MDGSPSRGRPGRSPRRWGLQIGQRVRLESAVQSGSSGPSRSPAVFGIDDPTEHYWWADPQGLEGVVTSMAGTDGRFSSRRRRPSSRRTARAGPAHLARDPDAGAVTLAKTSPAFERGPPNCAGGSTHRCPAGVNVTTDLPAILATAERSLLVSRTGVVLLSVQLVVLAVYAVLLSASLLTEHRQGGDALLRSRGAGTRQIVGLALIEGLLSRSRRAAGPVARRGRPRGIQRGRTARGDRLVYRPERDRRRLRRCGRGGRDLPGRPDAAGVLASRSHAVPVTPGARRRRGSVAARHRHRIAGDRRPRVVAAPLYGSPLTHSIPGTIGLDPLLVAAPAIGLLAGALFALRIIPLVAQLLERATTRGRGRPSLGSRSSPGDPCGTRAQHCC